jgi:Kef-type K+ transport system membrane component KefB
MVSRGDVGFIVTEIGVTTGVISGDVYNAIIVRVAVTTIITPIWIKKAYKKINNIDLILCSQNKVHI